MDEKEATATPGPYDSKAKDFGPSIEIRSPLTGELLATVHGGNSHSPQKFPDAETALQNASMFRRAPEMKAALETLLEQQQSPMHPDQAGSIQRLLTEMKGGDREQIQQSKEDYNRSLEKILSEYVPQRCSFKITSATFTDLDEETDEEEEEGPEHGW